MAVARPAEACAGCWLWLRGTLCDARRRGMEAGKRLRCSKTGHSVLQNGPFYTLKRAVLHLETGRFAGIPIIGDLRRLCSPCSPAPTMPGQPCAGLPRKRLVRHCVILSPGPDFESRRWLAEASVLCLAGKLVGQRQHEVAGDAVVSRLGAALGVHGVVFVRQLVKQVEGR